MRSALVKHKLVASAAAGRRTNLTQQERDQELLLLAESALESNNLVPLVRSLPGWHHHPHGLEPLEDCYVRDAAAHQQMLRAPFGTC